MTFDWYCRRILWIFQSHVLKLAHGTYMDTPILMNVLFLPPFYNNILFVKMCRHAQSMFSTITNDSPLTTAQWRVSSTVSITHVNYFVTYIATSKNPLTFHQILLATVQSYCDHTKCIIATVTTVKLMFSNIIICSHRWLGKTSAVSNH